MKHFTEYLEACREADETATEEEKKELSDFYDRVRERSKRENIEIPRAFAAEYNEKTPEIFQRSARIFKSKTRG